jgi:DNA-directed RNA polymerase subunit RPC12/RpoP
LVLHGHGLRERQVRGPLECWGRPKTVIIAARRYQCQRCSAVILVVPRGIIRGRLFSAPAIAWALWLFGMEGLPPSRVRKAVSPWQTAGWTAAAGWAQLKRWVRDVRHGRLFGGLPSAAGGGVRTVAERVTTALGAKAPPSAWDASPESQVWQGALHAGAGIAG